MKYYERLDTSSESARRSGWRRTIGQRVRFEMALEPWNWTRLASVVDVGCGTGDLLDYLGTTGRSATYTGIDTRSSVVEANRGAARAEAVDGMQARWIAGDVYDTEHDDLSADLAVAIGTVVDGEPVETEEARVERVRRLVERIDDLAGRAACMVVLDQDYVESRPMLAREEAIFGMREGELVEVAEGIEAPTTVRSDGLRSDLLLYLGDDTAPAEGRDWKPVGAHEYVLSEPNGEEWSEVDRGWLWLEAGHLDRAENVLGDLAESSSEEVVLLRERLRHMRRH